MNSGHPMTAWKVADLHPPSFGRLWESLRLELACGLSQRDHICGRLISRNAHSDMSFSKWLAPRSWKGPPGPVQRLRLTLVETMHLKQSNGEPARDCQSQPSDCSDVILLVERHLWTWRDWLYCSSASRWLRKEVGQVVCCLAGC